MMPMPRWLPTPRCPRAAAAVAVLLLQAGGGSAGQVGHQQEAGSLRAGGGKQHPPSPSSSSFRPVDIRRLSEPVPQVRHYKVPGSGYTRHSPLYAKQTAWGNWSDPEAVAVPSRETTTWQQESLQSSEDMVAAVPDLMPPVSTTVLCITNLTCQFFVVYSVLFLLQTSSRLGLITSQREEKAFASVVETVYFVPPLCVLFMATRMRAVQLTRGEPEQYGLPQWWVKAAMQACSWSMLALTMLVLVLSLVQTDVANVRGKKLGSGATVLRYLHSFIMVVVYLSFTAVCIGACTMQVPPQLTGDPPRERAALVCTLWLTALYFGVYLARGLATFANRHGFLGQAMRFGNAQEVLRSATTTVSFAPMLAVVFLAASIRTMQGENDGLGHWLPRWVQVCFYICTLSVLLQTACIVAVFVLVPEDGTLVDGAARRRTIARAVDYLRLLAMAVLYVCVLLITVGALLLPRSAVMSAELDCVAALAALYFGVYLMQWAVHSVRQERGGEAQAQDRSIAGVLEESLHDAKVQVQFCPMFCVLFLACLLRALRVTDGHGAPQRWCQTVECIATGAIICLVLLSFERLVPKTVPNLSRACGFLKYALVATLYASAIATVYGLYVMTPETVAAAEGRAEPLTVLLPLGRHALGFSR